MAFWVPALLKSMDRQCGQHVEKNLAALIMIRYPFSRHSVRMGRRDSASAWSRVNVDRSDGRQWRGLFRARPPVVPGFSGRAPTLSLVLSHVQPDACAASAVFCSSVYYSPDSSTTLPIVASVVSMSEAMEAAFCRAVRVTLVGSITPAVTRSSYCSVAALKPKFGS